jgi:hypothetical protein
MAKQGYAAKIPMLSGMLCLLFGLVVLYFLFDFLSKRNKTKEGLDMRPVKKMLNASSRNVKKQVRKLKKRVTG